MRRAVFLLSILLAIPVFAEKQALAQEWNLVYGDIVMMENEEAMKEAQVGAVIFPHWFHRIRFRCKVCHETIFTMKKGANKIDMEKISSGQQCGVCHDGRIAWDPLYCERCHAIPWDSQIVRDLKMKEGKVEEASPPQTEGIREALGQVEEGEQAEQVQ